MLDYLLGFLIHDRDLHFIIVNGAYYAIILFAIVTGCIYFFRKMVSMGFGYSRVLAFITVFFCLALPLGYYSSRAANMFYYPVSYWSFDLFVKQMLTGTKHTFHASLLLPIVMTCTLIRLFRFPFRKVIDAIFLHIPFVHALARFACLMAGCCWGHELNVQMLGFNAHFHNPIPLYESAFNFSLYLFLKKVFYLEHEGEELKSSGIWGKMVNWFFRKIKDIRIDGKIVALYLACYSVYRFNIEFIRTNPVITLGLTQAQLVMIGFFGAACLIAFKRKITFKKEILSFEYPARKEVVSLAGFLISYAVLAGSVLMLFRFDIIDWPFKSYSSFLKIYFNVFLYLIFAILCSSLCYWLKRIKPDWTGWFRWEKITAVFWVGMVFSCIYSIYLFQMNTRMLHGQVSYLFPIIFFSALNAYSEEIVYRLALMNILEKVIGSNIIANMIQASLYGATHYFIGGIKFAFFAFLYGILMGTITRQSRSILPAMVCHFCIDIGNVGLPFLMVRDYFF